MGKINEGIGGLIKLGEFMDGPSAWGRAEGRVVFQKLLEFVEKSGGKILFPVSLEGVSRLDISFASETLVEIARRFRGTKGFYFIDLLDEDLVENWDAAALRKEQPLMSWNSGVCRILGLQPTQGTRAALEFALDHVEVRAAAFAAMNPEMSIANVSSKFRQLWEQGFLLRLESAADTGGVEYVYRKIG